jgi:hypothetical protein
MKDQTMKNKRILSYFLASALITGCSANFNPLKTFDNNSGKAQNTILEKPTFLSVNDFSTFEKEYGQFKTKALSQSYLLRKIKKWINLLPESGQNLAKELEYARFKHSDLTISLFAENPELKTAIEDVPEILSRLEIPSFAAFIRILLNVGGEFQVNTYTSGDQANPAIGMNPVNGKFIVAWEGYGRDGDAPDQSNIYARKFSNIGIPEGNEFLVNDNSAGSQVFPAVAMDTGGDFVITWHGPGDPSTQTDVFAKLYKGNTSSEFRVNTVTDFNQFYSSVKMDNTGKFVIAYTSFNAAFYEARVKGYDSTGTPVANCDFAAGPSGGVSMDMNSAGDFILGMGNGYLYDGFVQKFNPECSPVGPAVQVNKAGGANVAMDDDGDYTLLWFGYYERDGNDQLITNDIRGGRATRYNSNDVEQPPPALDDPGRISPNAGGDYLVNIVTNGWQAGQRLAMNKKDANDVVFTWHSQNQDGDGYGIYAETISNPNAEFRVNTTTTGDQLNPQVAMDNSGNFVIVWDSNHDQDGSGKGIFGQAFDSSGNPK